MDYTEMILFINDLINKYEYHYCTGKCVRIKNNDMCSIRILEDILEVIEKEREKNVTSINIFSSCASYMSN